MQISAADAKAVLTFFDRLATSVEKSPETYGLSDKTGSFVTSYIDQCSDDFEAHTFGREALELRKAYEIGGYAADAGDFFVNAMHRSAARLASTKQITARLRAPGFNGAMMVWGFPVKNQPIALVAGVWPDGDVLLRAFNTTDIQRLGSAKVVAEMKTPEHDNLEGKITKFVASASLGGAWWRESSRDEKKGSTFEADARALADWLSRHAFDLSGPSLRAWELMRGIAAGGPVSPETVQRAVQMLHNSRQVDKFGGPILRAWMRLNGAFRTAKELSPEFKKNIKGPDGDGDGKTNEKSEPPKWLEDKIKGKKDKDKKGSFDLSAYEKEAEKWKSLPDGWTGESAKKFWTSLTGDVKKKVTKCIKQMEGKVDNPGAFCASLRDKVEGKGWRSDRRGSFDLTAYEKTSAMLSQTNLALMASQYAARAFSKGERHGGSANRTTYPVKWYRELERTFGGPLDARLLKAFDILYDWQMWQLTNGKQIMRWPDEAVQLMQQAGLK